MLALGEKLCHLPLPERSHAFGSYDAQKGEEVVTNLSRILPGLAKLGEVRHPRLLLFSVPAVVLLAACGASARTQEGESGAAAHVIRHCRPGTRPVGSNRVAVAAVVVSHARAYRRPGRRPFASFGRLNVNRYPTTFHVLDVVRRRDCRAGWYRVQLPIRPNGVTGFIRAHAVEVGRVRTRILVDLSARKLTLFRRGRPVLQTTVAIGSRATPTPTGRYYVNQRLLPADSSGPYGPAALGVSAFSNVLTGWTQGGPIGIHGTNEPWSIGRAVSNGCIRLRNPVLKRLFAQTRAGTPVIIHR
jgi:lipoprotein-anchoring transpeptidase ErfK/SrfK